MQTWRTGSGTSDGDRSNPLHQNRGLGWGMPVTMNFSRGRISLKLGQVPEGCLGGVSCPGRCSLVFLMAFPG